MSECRLVFPVVAVPGGSRCSSVAPSSERPVEGPVPVLARLLENEVKLVWLVSDRASHYVSAHLSSLMVDVRGLMMASTVESRRCYAMRLLSCSKLIDTILSPALTVISGFALFQASNGPPLGMSTTRRSCS